MLAMSCRSQDGEGGRAAGWMNTGPGLSRNKARVRAEANQRRQTDRRKGGDEVGGLVSIC